MNKYNRPTRYPAWLLYPIFGDQRVWFESVIVRTMRMTDEEFAELSWPAQDRVLDFLVCKGCQCEGKTHGEANKKRAPYDAQWERFHKIKDAQWREFIHRVTLPELEVLKEIEDATRE